MNEQRICEYCPHIPHSGPCLGIRPGETGSRGPCECVVKLVLVPRGLGVQSDAEQSDAEQVDHPAHYGGTDNVYEVIKVLEAWGLTNDAYLFNVVKYVARAGKKGAVETDLRKAAWYLNRRIEMLDGQSD